MTTSSPASWVLQVPFVTEPALPLKDTRTATLARFLGFVNVLEVLKDQGPASKAAQDLVQRWMAQAAGGALDPDEAASIRGNLDRLRSISISRGIASVVSRHLGPGRAGEAKALYTVRSQLVHEGKRLLDSSETVQRAEKVARELLANIVKSGVL